MSKFPTEWDHIKRYWRLIPIPHLHPTTFPFPDILSKDTAEIWSNTSLTVTSISSVARIFRRHDAKMARLKRGHHRGAAEGHVPDNFGDGEALAVASPRIFCERIQVTLTILWVHLRIFWLLVRYIWGWILATWAVGDEFPFRRERNSRDMEDMRKWFVTRKPFQTTNFHVVATLWDGQFTVFQTMLGAEERTTPPGAVWLSTTIAFEFVLL